VAKKTTSKTDKAPKSEELSDDQKLPENDDAEATSAIEQPNGEETQDDGLDAEGVAKDTKDGSGDDSVGDTMDVSEAEASEPSETDSLESDAPRVDGDEDANTTDVALDENAEPPSSTVTPPAKPDERPRVMPMIFGGVVAGAIGFAAAYFGLAQQPDKDEAALTKQVNDVAQALEDTNASLSAVSQDVQNLSDASDVAPLEDQLSGLTDAIANLSERVVGAETKLEDIETRLSQLELQPVSEGASDAAVAAYESELEAARQEIAQQRSELETLIENAVSAEKTAEDAARAAVVRAATSRILAALDNGEPFADAVTNLQEANVDVPDDLIAASNTGVPSMADLQNRFPEAARAALSASRTVSSEGGGLSGFLRNQLGARSLEPREGNDPDAVLSRTEAALREGRLSDALSEIEALPEEGRAELSDWANDVAQRAQAQNAAQSLNETWN